MSGQEQALTSVLVAAAEYGVAKAVALGLLSCDDEAVRVIARGATRSIVEELAAREEHLREVTPADEVGASRDECAVRASDFRRVAADLADNPS